LKKKKSLRAPLKSWDFFSLSLQKQSDTFNRQTEIQILNEYKEKYGWVFNVEEVLNNSTYDAIVLTNMAQEIQWVNKGFIKMTGYPVGYAQGKTPKFLQGENSSKIALNGIRENLKKGVHFEAKVINYRKNNQEYNCNIEIYPLRNEHNEICHLLALEREVYM